MEPHPIRMVVEDDLARSRLTVFFRLLLAIPHLIWLTLWGIAIFLAAILSWFIVLILGTAAGRAPSILLGVRALLDTRVAFLTARRQPVPRFHRPARELPGRSRDRPPGSPESLEDRLPPSACTPGARPSCVARRRSDARSRRRLGRGNRSLRGRDRVDLDPGSVLRRRAGRNSRVLRVVRLRSRAHGARKDSGTSPPTRLRYGAQAGGYLMFLTDRYPSLDTENPTAPQAPPVKPVRLRVGRRPSSLEADRLLPPPALPAALRLVVPLGLRRVLRRDRKLVRDTRHWALPRGRCTAS